MASGPAREANSSLELPLELEEEEGMEEEEEGAPDGLLEGSASRESNRKFAVRLVHYTLASFTDCQAPDSQARGMRGWE